MTASPQPIRVALRARQLVAALVVAFVLAVTLVVVGGHLVMSASTSVSPSHATVPASHGTGGSNRARLPE